MAPPASDSLMNVATSLATTLPLDGSAVLVWIPKLSAVASPLTVIVSVEFDAVMVMLPFSGSADAMPPARPESARFKSAIVCTWPTPVPKLIVNGALGGLVPTAKVSVCGNDAALCVSRLVAFLVPADNPSSLSTANVLVPAIVILVLASALVRTRWLVPSRLAVTSVVPVAKLILDTTAFMLSKAAIAIGVPLMSSVPPADDKLVRTCEPVNTAAPSGNKVALLPIILAAAGTPATGLAEKFA